MWQDLNQNGVSEPGEVRTLAEVGITSIDLRSDDVQVSALTGAVTILGKTSFTFSDGRLGTVGDVVLNSEVLLPIDGKYEFNGGDESTYRAVADTDWTLFDNFITATDGRRGVELSDFTNVELIGGDSSNRIEVVSWVGNVKINGGGGNDTIIVRAGSGAIVTIEDSGAGDELTIVGTNVGDLITVTKTQILVFPVGAGPATPPTLTVNLGATPPGRIRVSAGDGDDEITVVSFGANTLVLDGDEGADEYELIRADAGSRTTIIDSGTDDGAIDELTVFAGGPDSYAGLVPSEIKYSNFAPGVGLFFTETIEEFEVKSVDPILNLVGNGLFTVTDELVTFNGSTFSLTGVTRLTITTLGSGSTIDVQSIPATLACVGPAGVPPTCGFEVIATAGDGDTLIGPDAANLWSITGADSGSLSGTPDVAFVGIENITGGANADTFSFGASGSISGTIDGAGGVDSIDYSSTPTGVTFDLSGGKYVGLETLVGSNGADELIGPDAPTLWTVTGANAGRIADLATSILRLTFSLIEKLTGGSDVDRFVIESGGSVSGQIDGGLGDNELAINGSGNDDVVVVDATAVVFNGLSTTHTNIANVAVDTHGGLDTITVNPAAAAAGFPGTVTVRSGDDDDELFVNLSVGGEATINLDGGAPAASDTLTITGTTGIDTIVVDGLNVTSGATAITLAMIENLTINAGDGADELTVGGTTVTGDLIVNGQGDDDDITVQYPVSTGTLTVDGGTGAGNNLNVLLTVDADDVNLGASTVQVTGQSTTNYSNFSTVNLGTGDGVDNVTIADTQGTLTTVDTGGDADTVLITGSTTELVVNTGDGEDAVNVRAIGGQVTLNLGGDTDAATVGSLAPAAGGVLIGIAARLIVNGELGDDRLIIDNSGDVGANSGVLNDIELTGVGLAAGIGYDSIAELEITLGAFADAFTVMTTSDGADTTLNTGAGADIVDVGAVNGTATINTGDGSDVINVVPSAAGSVGNVSLGIDTSAINGLLTVNAGGAAGDIDTLNFTNEWPTIEPGFLSSTQITGLEMPRGITYGGVEDLNIVTRTSGVEFTIESTHTGTTELSTNALYCDTASGDFNAGPYALDSGECTFVYPDALGPDGAGFECPLGGVVTEEFDTGDPLDLDDDVLTARYCVLDVSGANSDIINVFSTAGVTDISTFGGADVINIQTIDALTTVNAGDDNDTVNVGSVAASIGGTVDNISALLTVNGDGGTDTLNVDDIGDTTPDTGELTDTTITGLGMSDGIVYGTFETLNIGLGTAADLFNVTSTHAGTTNITALGGNDEIILENISGNVTVDTGALPGGDDADLVRVVSTNPGSTLVINTGALRDWITVVSHQGDVTINAGADSDTIEVGSNAGANLLVVDTGGKLDTIIGKLVINGDEETAIAADGAGAFDRLFIDDTGNTADTVAELTTSTLKGLSIAAADGILYSNIESVNIATGSGAEIFNVAGTTAGSGGFAAAGEVAVTNLDLGDGDDKVFVSSAAALDATTASTVDFLTGDLDDIHGALNIDLGAGRHRLFITDEASTVGDADIVITDTVPADAGSRRLATDADIWITGLTGDPAAGAGGISYTVDPAGNLFDGVVYWTGAGDDTISIDGTSVAAGGRTTTMLNTGLGDDIVTVDLDAGEDGFFVLHTSGGSASAADDNPGVPNQITQGAATDDDTVDASTSTLPLIIFGGFGEDRIAGGSAGDIIFGDFGEVSGADASYGRGGTGDMISALRPEHLAIVSRHIETGGGDQIRAGEGDNTVIGGVGSDDVDAGAGRDVIVGDTGLVFLDESNVGFAISNHPAVGTDDTINAGDGDNVVIAGSGVDTVTTGDGADVIVGDDGDAFFNPSGLLLEVRSFDSNEGGDDIVIAGEGDNVVIAGRGADQVTTGTGDDLVLGDNGIAVFSITGNSILRNLSPRDLAVGGNDRIDVGAGDNVVLAGMGDDEVTAGIGNDLILGDNAFANFDTSSGSSALRILISDGPLHGGNDIIEAGDGENVVVGGSGNDKVTSGSGTDVVLGDNGIVNFDTTVTPGMSLVEKVTSAHPGDGGADEIDAGAGANVVIAGVGNDTVSTLGDDDLIIGDNGSAEFDTTTGAPALSKAATSDPADGGADMIDAGDGNNTVLAGSGEDKVNAGVGNDVVVGDNGSAEFDTTTPPGSSVVKLVTSDPTSGAKDTIKVGDGANVVIAGQGDDEVTSGSGADVIVGDNGSVGFDTTTTPRAALVSKVTSSEPGDGGMDTIEAGAGNNTVIAGVGDDEVTTLGGDDVVIGDNGSVEFETTTGAPALSKAQTSDPADGGADMIDAGDGNNTVLAGSGEDKVNTGSGADVVVGDNGSAEFDTTTTPGSSVVKLVTSDPTQGAKDTIKVGDGANVVIAGQGDDEVTAGTGADVVVGDNGSAVFDTTTTPGTAILKSVTSSEPADGGNDNVDAGDGDNVVVAGVGDDNVTTTGGDDVVIGDNGSAEFDTTTMPGTSTLAKASTSHPDDAGADTIDVGEGANVVLGGSGGDKVRSGTGVDVVVGDNGSAEFDTTTTPGTSLVKMVTSSVPGTGGADEIDAGDGANVVIAGAGDDTVTTYRDDDVVIGDNGSAEFDTSSGKSTLATASTSHPDDAGADTIDVGEGVNVVLAGSGADKIRSGTGADVVVGDNGSAEFDTKTKPGTSLVKMVTSTDPASGGNDTVDAGDGNNVVIAGVGDDKVTTTGGDDVVIGDNGNATFDTSTGAPAVKTAATSDPGQAGADTIDAGEGNNVVLAGTGDDKVKTGAGIDVIVGDNGQAMFDTTTTPGTPIISMVTSADPASGGNDTVDAGDGNNVVIAGTGDDKVTTGSGKDVVVGDNGNATFDTRLGFPQVATAATSDPEHGGDDLISTGDGADAILAGSGSDTVEAGRTGSTDPSLDIVVADNGALVFDTTSPSGAVTLTSTDPTFGGDDKITTGAGAAFVVGGAGKDTIDTSAGASDDIVLGDNGDALLVNGKPSRIRGTFAWTGDDDLIDTGNGNDVVIGGSGGDRITAGTYTGLNNDSDVVLGDNGVIYFDAWARLTNLNSTDPSYGGDDFIHAGAESDVVIAGAGHDTISTGGGEDLVIADNGAAEFVSPLGTARPVVQLARSTNPQYGGNDFVHAGPDDDIVFGGSFSDIIYGGAGNDLLFGDHGLFDRLLPAEQQFRSIFTGNGDAGGSDTIYGDDGPLFSTRVSGGFDDVILGQQGDDTLIGGEGEDDITGGHNVVGGADGNDTIEGNGGSDVVLGDNGSIRRVLGGMRYPAPFADVIRLITRFDKIDQVAGNDQIDGGGGRDTLHGQAGDDRIHGRAGDDNIFGDRGSDYLNGGAGHDVVLAEPGQIIRAFNLDGTPRTNRDGSWRRDVILEDEGTIIDYIDGGVDYTTGFTPELAARIARADLILVAGILPTGQSPWDTLLILIDFIAASNNIIEGGAGNDVLFGGAAHDRIAGGAGNDQIVGGLGDDNLLGGGGGDLIVGDDATNTALRRHLARILHGLRLTGDVSNQTGLIRLAADGTLVIPDAYLHVGRFDCAARGAPLASVLTGQQAAGDPLVRLDGAAINTTFGVELDRDRSAGNDLVDGGIGDDIVIGDNLTISQVPARLPATQQVITRFADSVARVLQRFAKLIIWLDAAQDSAGSDELHGGRGQDLLIGDNVWFSVSPSSVAEVVAAQRLLIDLEHIALDLSNLVDEAYPSIMAGLKAAEATFEQSQSVDLIDAAARIAVFGAVDADEIVPNDARHNGTGGMTAAQVSEAEAALAAAGLDTPESTSHDASSLGSTPTSPCSPGLDDVIADQFDAQIAGVLETAGGALGN